MKYGYIIKMSHLKSFFFIHYIDHEVIKLIDNTKDINNIIEYNIQKDIIDKNITITIIYKPYTSSYILLNGLTKGKLINMNEEKDINHKYKILNINEQKDQLILQNIETKKEKKINFNFRGLPKEINYLIQLKDSNVNKNNENTNTNNESLNNENKNRNNENDTEYYYYYSIEQQVSTIIEDLLTKDKEKDREERKKIMKIIKRYIELNKKHYNENNEYIKKKYIFTKELIEKHNILYTPVSNALKIIKYIIKDENDQDMLAGNLQGFYLDDGSYEFNEFLQGLKNDDISDDEFLNQISEQSEVFSKKKYNIQAKKGQEIYLGPGGDLYPLIITENKDININGFLSKNKKEIKYEIFNSESSSLLNKSITNYPYDNSKNKYINNTKYPKDCDDFFPKIPIFYELKGDYDDFIKQIKPDVFTFIRCFSGNYYSLKDVNKNLSLLNIEHLNDKDYKKMIGLISKHIKQYKTEIINEKTNKLRDKTENNDDRLKIKEIIKDKYKYISNDYFSYSEMISFIHKKLLIFNIIKNNLYNRNDEIEININVEDKRKIIEKIYKSKEDLLKDEGKPIIYKDVLNNGEDIKSIDNLQYRSSIENLYELFKKNNYVGSKTEFIHFFKNEYDINDEKYKLLKQEVEKFKTENKLYEGAKAYVIEEDTLYIYDEINKRWITKTNLLNTEHDEITYQLLKNFNTNSGLLELKYSDDSFVSLMKEIKYIEDKKIKNELKYQNQKRKYAQMMSGYKTITSPNLELFHEILSQSDLKKKMNELYLFIDISTIEGEDNVFWLYCKETGTKLVPYFYKILSDAYHKNEETYFEKLEELCKNQGKIEGNLFVDKYSGYTIKNINFDTEEGYNKQGFKVTTREILKKEDKYGIIVSKDDEPKYKNIITIINLINIQLEGEDIQKMISFINECINNYNTEKYKKMKKENKDMIYLISFLSTFFVYIQTYKDIDNLDSYYLNCKPSFGGFPLEKEEDKEGIEYILCIFDNLRKTNSSYPWDVKEIKKMKLEEIKDEMVQCILKNLLNIEELKNELLEKRKIYKKIIKDHKNINKEQWELFLPRLNPLNIIIENEISNYQQCFNVQYKLNEFFIKQKKIYTNDKKDYIKYVYLSNNKIELKHEIRDLINSIPYDKKITKISYYIEDTRNDYYSTTLHSYQDETIYKTLIELFKNNIKTEYDKYNTTQFDEMEHKEKLDYMSKNIVLNDEETKKNIIKLKSKIITLPKIEENLIRLKTFETLEQYDIIDIEKNKKTRSIFIDRFNDVYKMISSKKSPIKNIFMTDYIDFENINKEEADYYTDILFNRTKEIMTLSNIKKNKIYYEDFHYLLPNKIFISYQHREEIMKNIFNNNIKKGEIETYNFPENNIENFEKLNSIKSFIIHNKILRLKIAHIVLHGILMEFSIDGYSILQYLNDTKYNNNVNKILVNNYSKITKTKEGHKGLEKNLMTDKLEKMTVEYRKLDTELKQRKLGNWGKGLSDNMYKYSKEGHNRELIENKELLDAIKKFDNEQEIYNEQQKYNEEEGRVPEYESETLEDLVETEYEDEEVEYFDEY